MSSTRSRRPRASRPRAARPPPAAERPRPPVVATREPTRERGSAPAGAGTRPRARRRTGRPPSTPDRLVPSARRAGDDGVQEPPAVRPELDRARRAARSRRASAGEQPDRREPTEAVPASPSPSPRELTRSAARVRPVGLDRRAARRGRSPAPETLARRAAAARARGVAARAPGRARQPDLPHPSAESSLGSSSLGSSPAPQPRAERSMPGTPSAASSPSRRTRPRPPRPSSRSGSAGSTKATAEVRSPPLRRQTAAPGRRRRTVKKWLATAWLAGSAAVTESPAFLLDYLLRALRVAVLLSLWRVVLGQGAASPVAARRGALLRAARRGVRGPALRPHHARRRVLAGHDRAALPAPDGAGRRSSPPRCWAAGS